jgi:hypothetical protein
VVWVVCVRASIATVSVLRVSHMFLPIV